MARTFHFISGLPRSGSTLLAALLRQNPRFYAYMSSPVAQLYGNLQTAMGARSEFHPIVSDTRRISVLRGLFDNYYADLPSGRVVFDTNRMWTGKMSGLVGLHPHAKVICCVRSLARIVNSVEQLVRNNPYETSRMFNFNASGTIYTRTDMINGPNGMLGLPYGALKEAYFGPYADRLLLVPYAALVRNPRDVLAEIYSFLGEAYFKHDVEQVELEADAFDRRLGLPGLHRVSGPVKPRPSSMLLPPDLIQRFKQSQFWTDPERNPRNVRVIRLAPPPAGGDEAE